MLAEKLKKFNTNTWLINTGWTGGKYGIGHRMDLPSTRAIIDAIHSGELDKAETETLPVFNLQVPKHCKGVDESILIPKNTWADKEDYDRTLRKLAEAFA